MKPIFISVIRRHSGFYSSAVSLPDHVDVLQRVQGLGIRPHGLQLHPRHSRFCSVKVIQAGSKFSRGEICVTSFIPPANGASLDSNFCVKNLTLV